MQNIKNHNFNKLDLKLSYSEFWDFYISTDQSNTDCVDCDIPENCLIAGFTFNSESGRVITSDYVWSGAISSGENIPTYGLTGLDNGQIEFIFDESDFANQNLVDALTGTTLEIPTQPTLSLTAVNGYTDNVSYPLESQESWMDFKGGFYQGFYKLEGYDYQVLPNRYNKGFVFEFNLLKDDSLRGDEPILNDLYPSNKGIFFYWGTRAENKFWNQFKGLNEVECDETSLGLCTNIKEGDIEIIDENGHILPLKPPLTTFTEISNEFLLYGRAKGEGLGTMTSCDVSGDTPSMTISAVTTTITDTTNPFLIYGRSNGKTNGSRPSDGYGRETVCSYSGNTSEVTELDKDADIYDNAFALMIDDEGRIGYRLLTSIERCVDDKLTNEIILKEEWSEVGLINDSEWTKLAVRFTTNYYDDCDLEHGKQRTGRLMFYVNCKLKYIVEDFPEFIAKGLNEYKEKQVAVPYNISIGGGTQGLLESMTFDGQDPNDLGLYIEQFFAGSFIGSISKFNIYNCDLNWCEISKLCPITNLEPVGCYLVDENNDYIVDNNNNYIDLGDICL